MTATTKNLGNAGENFAARYLEQHGYKILEKNFRVRSAEIDIIAQIGDVIVFVEVKTRSNIRYGLPAEAVNFRKQKKLSKRQAYFFKTKNILIRPAVST